VCERGASDLASIRPAWRRQQDVLENGQPRKQRGVLKHQPGSRVDARTQRFVVNEDAPGGGLVQPGDEAQQRRFPTAASPDDGDHFAPTDLEAHGIQRAICTEVLGDVFNVQ
jgi:hypothetical protein